MCRCVEIAAHPVHFLSIRNGTWVGDLALLLHMATISKAAYSFVAVGHLIEEQSVVTRTLGLVGFFGVLISLAGCDHDSARGSRQNSAVLSVTADNFQKEVLDSPNPVMVDFSAEWCGPCQMMAPVIEELAQEYQGRASIVMVDVDEQPELAGRYQVQAIPTFLFFENGEIVGQLRGAIAKEQFSTILDDMTAPPTADK